ncbi:MAG TPA: serine hydrolase domain-containing protein [Opitutaceae bacterium]|nr:serine hydrolase domain-containing protein [Opitutaceae bacterium]
MNRVSPPVLGMIVAILLILTQRAWSGSASALGFDESRLHRLDAVIDETIAQKKLAGGVIYIARDGQIAQLKAYGMQDIEKRKPMPVDAIFRIASMSKAVTSVAAMILYEEGKFMLHDPISRFIPGFKNSVVAVPAPEDGSARGRKFVTVPAKRGIQIRDLLTHTAGLTYGTGLAADLYKEAGLSGWYFANKNETIGEAVDRLAKLPLHGQPGESWQYGYASDVLGRLVEVASGMPLDRFVKERITDPLRMPDTCFFLPVEKADRLAPVYGMKDGVLTLQEKSATSDYIHGPRKCFSGGAGLLSTITDYGRFLQMLLNGGELDGVRILGPKTVELMHANHTGKKYERDTSAFGLGFWVNDDLGYYGELGTEGAYGWGSAYFPQYLVDPKERMVAIFMTQLMPAGGLDLNQKFKVLTYQALIR